MESIILASMGKLMDTFGLGVWGLNPNTGRFEYSARLVRSLGLGSGEMSVDPDIHFNRIHPEDRASAHIVFEDCLSGRSESFEQELRLVLGDGRILWIRENGMRIQPEGPGSPFVVCILSDISEQKERETEKQNRQVQVAARLEHDLSTQKSHAQDLEQRVQQTQQHLEQTRRMSAAMFDANPYINILMSDKIQVLDCNPTAMSYFGFETKEELIAGFLPLLMKSIPERQPDGRQSIPLMDRIRQTVAKGYTEFETELVLGGRSTAMQVVLKKIPYEGTFAIVAYLIDLHDLKEAESELVQQDHLLRSVNDVASVLMRSTPETFEQNIWEAFKTIGQLTGVDRMYVWQNYTQDDKPFCRQTYEWSEGAEPQQGKDFTVELDYADVPYWRDCVYSNTVLNAVVADLPPEERAVLEPQEILSILVIPILIRGKPWGFIGFDNCRSQQLFRDFEEKVLRSAGNLIVSAILRNDMTRSLIDAREDLMRRDLLLRSVNDTASLLMAQSNDDFGASILSALEILGRSVDADRAYIWRNSMENGELCVSQYAEWAREKISNHGDAPATNIPYSSFLPNLQELLDREEGVHLISGQMDEALAAFPGMEDVRSLLVAPLIIQGEFWGFIGVDDCHNERDFTEMQEDILKSGGMFIATAIVRYDMTQNLVEAREAALGSMRAKSDFLSRMSHEIRTPMNAIIGMTTIARKSGDPEKIDYCLEKIDASSRQLLGIINDVLDMSKIEANKLEIIPGAFDFEVMMQNVFNVIQVRVEEKRQDFRFDLDRVFSRKMISDELRLSQVLMNLLSNAVKFTPEEGSIVLKTRETQLDDDHSRLRVEVIDSGIGVAKDRQESLFDSFEQADGTITRQFGGTGLGLAISKRIVELMGGRIWVESEPGHGSSFIFEVDVAWGEDIKADIVHRDFSADELHILVVDDSPDVLEYFTNIFQSFSLTCDTARDGYSAIEMVQKAKDEGDPYNVIFIDWNMPGINGGETAQQIQKIMSGHNAIVVMISAMDWSDIGPEVSKYAVSQFLPKPVLPSVLFNTILKLTDHSFMTSPHNTVPEIPKADWHGKRLLLVEDIEINREIVTSLLEETGIAIDTAADGREAVEKFTQNPAGYDIILMDVQMPVLDGLGATRRIRAMDDIPVAATIPIIAMTANAFKEDERDCLDAGMNAHVAKPLDVKALYEVMGRYLK